MSAEDQEVVLTPMPSNKPGGHVIRVERLVLSQLNKANVKHIAGGPYKGIIINKASPQDVPSQGGADSTRTFLASVADQSKEGSDNADDMKREKRTLQFWFEDMARMNASVIQALTDTYMKELLDPDQFPKDYISFVKRVLTLVRQYSAILKLELSILPWSKEDEEEEKAAQQREEEEQKAALLREEEERAALLRESTKTTRVTTTTTRVVAGQEDYRRLADGTLVDSRGNIVHEDPGSMGINSGQQLEMSSVTNGTSVDGEHTMTSRVTRTVTTTVTSGSSQEDYRMLADGTWVDSHGQVVDPDSIRMNGGPVLTKEGKLMIRSSQEDYRMLADGTWVDSHGHVVDPDSIRMNGGPVLTKEGKVIIRSSQEDYRMLADGTWVDSHGQVVDPESIRMNGGPILTKEGKVIIVSSQEDYRMLANGTWVDSHGHVVDPDTIRMNGGASLLRPGNSSLLERSDTSQADCLTQESFDRGGDVSLDRSPGPPTDSSTAKRGVVRRQPTITLKGWDMVWATKKQRLLNILEDAYPNVLNVNDLVKASGQKAEDVEYLMGDLQMKGMIKEIGTKRWIRMPQERKLTIKRQRNSRSSRTSMELSMDEGDKRRHEFKVVTHIPRLEEKEQPTVAVITLLYCEKLAVDAMMDFKTTYIRVKKTEGEGLVYTVGMIGGHRVVATKLPRIGHGQGATVSAGNSITRLLGTFGRIEHVILVGVGGGVANLKNESRHVKLGDIVVSTSANDQPAYVSLKDIDEGDGPVTKTWKPQEHQVSDIIAKLHDDYTKNTFFGGDWEKYIMDAEGELQGGDLRFNRPPADTDKLYKMQGETEIELDHPLSPVGSARNQFPNRPVIHLGPIGSGKQLSREDNLRQEFADTYNVLCIDSGFHAVMDSIEGNRKDSFAIVRGVSDYQDGTQRREWQAYASLVAAAFMKTILMDIPWEEDSDSD